MDIITVARQAGVSTATVSRVLNGSSKVREQTAERVRRVIQKLGYIPNNTARTLRSGRSNLYGVMVSDIRNPFFPDLVEHFQSLAMQHSIDVIVANTGYSEERLFHGVQRLLEREVDGIAVLTSEVSERLLTLLRQSRVPVVFLNQPEVIPQFRNVAVDYVNAFCEAVQHLRMLGHTQIGFVAGPPWLSSATRRKEAFMAAMSSCNMSVFEEWMLQGDHQISGGQIVGEQLFRQKRRPTAVICSNDMTAIGVLHAAHRLHRRIPEELSIVGFDDLLLSEVVQPALTTLHLSRREIASRAFLSLRAGLGIGLEGHTSTLQPRLVIRESTGPWHTAGY